MDKEPEFICDFCAKEIEEIDVKYCQLDETGHCILCGLFMQDGESEQ